MRQIPLFIVFGLACARTTTTAPVQPFSITFDEAQLQVGEQVLDFYNAGSGNLGGGPGPAFGIAFSPGWTVSPFQWFEGRMAEISAPATMDVLDGWEGPASFYCDGSGNLTVNYFDQLGGTGNLVDSITADQCSSGPWPEAQSQQPFLSAVFIPDGLMRIDTITFGAMVVPEPGEGALTVLGLLAVFGLKQMSRAVPRAVSPLPGASKLTCVPPDRRIPSRTAFPTAKPGQLPNAPGCA